MPSYLIEFRFSGYAKEAMRALKEGISKNFGVSKRKLIPHVTLAGEVYTQDEERLVRTVRDLCRGYDMMQFRLDGFDRFGNRVIYVRIRPSEELEKFRGDLAQRLGKFCEMSSFDKRVPFVFHATLVMGDIERKFNRIWQYVESWEIPRMDYHVVRVTILTEHRRILAEYDFVEGKMLDRREALDRTRLRGTIKKLEKRRDPAERSFEDVAELGKIFLFSDAHFDHDNIIRYCSRPFRSARQMNGEMASRWNESVGERDRVFYLGDMSYGRNRHPIDYWLGRLNGDVFYVRGNHDTDAILRATVIPDGYGIRYENYEFLLMHKPHRPHGYGGWIIHGDKHNNSPRHPFINQKERTVNVCAELVGYAPVSLERIVDLIETGRSYATVNG